MTDKGSLLDPLTLSSAIEETQTYLAREGSAVRSDTALILRNQLLILALLKEAIYEST